MEIFYEAIGDLIFEVIIFTILTLVATFIIKKLGNSSSRYLNPLEFLPEDELHTLKQMFYLVMMALCFANVLYSLLFINTDFFYFALFDVALSLIVAVHLDKSSTKNKIIFLLLVPYGALNHLLFDFSVVVFIEIIHVLIFIYFINVYYDKFTEYTRVHQLGATILLLFVIIFISFFITQYVELVNPLDALVMVSNAFTSNGYSILGTTVPGKVNSILLVWSGYILSSAGTATLTAAILIRYFNRRVKKLERIIEEGSDD